MLLNRLVVDMDGEERLFFPLPRPFFCLAESGKREAKN